MDAGKQVKPMIMCLTVKKSHNFSFKCAKCNIRPEVLFRNSCVLPSVSTLTNKPRPSPSSSPAFYLLRLQFLLYQLEIYKSEKLNRVHKLSLVSSQIYWEAVSHMATGVSQITVLIDYSSSYMLPPMGQELLSIFFSDQTTLKDVQ